MTATIAGMLAGFSLIIAIGAQNAFVLRQGIRREHVGVVVSICAACDFVLIIAGTLGVGALVTAHPVVLTVFKWAGAAYLLWFAFTSFRSAMHPQALEMRESSPSRSIVLSALAITLLNPHVYLDTVVMLGNLANQHGPDRWWFTLGACLASLIWFPALGYGARALAGPLGRPGVWRLIDLVIGMVMIAIAIRLITL
ncbi:LysE/ArgO family amino acid transporter [Brooklawnia propionicigenes]|jgi:L-lysine exporter family protein LysE/ArgO|uniref:LysE/ArgO family amino acid transporter n=2 Tax=root TaxID=1 RepID=A0AAN0KDV4_9ACTN|nr:LysE/ArgO family amino acid transporter [Brooklawnia sp. SH051]MEA5119980.1 LysE/ArgO family amino acid transporter [Propionibacterium sp.]BEH02149.1 LysE/ArgO family amino acid transporter [Brooklawnia sp. SH051]